MKNGGNKTKGKPLGVENFFFEILREMGLSGTTICENRGTANRWLKR